MLSSRLVRQTRPLGSGRDHHYYPRFLRCPVPVISPAPHCPLSRNAVPAAGVNFLRITHKRERLKKYFVSCQEQRKDVVPFVAISCGFFRKPSVGGVGGPRIQTGGIMEDVILKRNIIPVQKCRWWSCAPHTAAFGTSMCRPTTHTFIINNFWTGKD